MTPGWLRIKGACGYCGIQERTLRKWFQQGLRYSKIRGSVFIKLDWLDSFLEGYEVTNNKVSNDVDRITEELLGTRN